MKSLSDKMIWEEDYIGWCRGKDIKEAVKELKKEVMLCCNGDAKELLLLQRIDEKFGEKLI